MYHLAKWGYHYRRKPVAILYRSCDQTICWIKWISSLWMTQRWKSKQKKWKQRRRPLKNENKHICTYISKWHSRKFQMTSETMLEWFTSVFHVSIPLQKSHLKRRILPQCNKWFTCYNRICFVILLEAMLTFCYMHFILQLKMDEHFQRKSKTQKRKKYKQNKIISDGGQFSRSQP